VVLYDGSLWPKPNMVEVRVRVRVRVTMCS
jgi:hypothetical protein